MKTLNDLLVSLRDTSGLEPIDKLNILLAFLDTDRIVEHLDKVAVLDMAGVSSVSPSDSFAFAVLYLLRPDLIEGASPGDPHDG